MRLSQIGLAAVLVSLASFVAVAADWPQFQGPARNGIAPDKGLATSWSKDGPKELWKFNMNAGFSGAAVKGDKVYILDREKSKDMILCLDLATGEKLWDYPYDAPGRFDYPGARSTPTVDDKYIFTVGPTGEFYCFDQKTHKPLWHKSLVKDYDSKAAYWAVAQSPALYKDTVIVAPQGRKVGVVALEKKTGKQVWASDAIGGMSYSSPLVTTIDKVTQVVMTSANSTVGVDVKTGKILWHYEGWRCGIPIVTATDVGDGKLFLTSIASNPYNSDCAMFQPQLKGGKWAVKQLFKNGECQSQMHNALVYDKHLYASSAANGKGVICMDLDGKVLWDSGGGYDNGSNIVIADGMIYAMDGALGMLHLIKASPEGFKELAKAKVLNRNQTWAPMAISDGKLLCRDQRQLKCLDISGKK